MVEESITGYTWKKHVYAYISDSVPYYVKKMLMSDEEGNVGDLAYANNACKVLHGFCAWEHEAYKVRYGEASESKSPTECEILKLLSDESVTDLQVYFTPLIVGDPWGIQTLSCSFDCNKENDYDFKC
jgi:hypothetical protein